MNSEDSLPQLEEFALSSSPEPHSVQSLTFHPTLHSACSLFQFNFELAV
jgi:hypothetical protein